MRTDEQSPNEKVSTDCVMGTSETVSMQKECEISASEDEEPMYKAPKHADDAAETESSDSDEQLSSEEQDDESAEKDVTPIPEPEPKQKGTYSSTAPSPGPEWTSERQDHHKPAAEQEYSFFFEESQNKIFAPEIIFKEISSMREYLNKTGQTSGAINLLDENKKVKRTFKLVEPLKRSKVEELFS